MLIDSRYLADYNDFYANKMRLVLFLNALEHVCRLSRILMQPGGHALLVGVGGSGRRSLTRLAVFMQDYRMFEIAISKVRERMRKTVEKRSRKRRKRAQPPTRAHERKRGPQGRERDRECSVQHV